MKKTLMLAFIVCSAVIFGNLVNAVSSNAEVSDADHSPSASEFVSWGANYYKLTVTNKDGWKFVPAYTEKDGDGERCDPNDAENATGQIIVNPENAPESFTLKLEGKMYKPGGTGGSLVPWSASADTNFSPYYVVKCEEIMALGGSVKTFTAKTNSTATSSNWTCTEFSPINGKDSIDVGSSGDWVPTATGKHTITAKKASDTSIEAYAYLYVVDITRPAKNGDPSKWVTDRYDCQAVESGTTGKYNLNIVGNWATRNDGSWSLSPANGTITDTGSSSTTYSPPATKGSVTLNLKFDVTGDSAIDSRSITIFKDHLERDKFNFGTGRSCGSANGQKWKPKALYGLTDSNVGEITPWNCFGSVRHAFNNTGGGRLAASFAILNRTVQPKNAQIEYYEKAANATFSSSTLGTLQRGDVIYYKAFVLNYWNDVHAQTVDNASLKSTYGANNAIPTNGVTWTWATSAAGEWVNGIHQSVKARIWIYR